MVTSTNPTDLDRTGVQSYHQASMATLDFSSVDGDQHVGKVFASVCVASQRLNGGKA